MTFLGILGGLAALLAVAGTVIGVRRHRASDHLDRLESRDEPGRGHVDGQAGVGAAHHGRSAGSGSLSV